MGCQGDVTEGSEPSVLNSEKEWLISKNIKDQLASKVAKNIALNTGEPLVVDFMLQKAQEQFDEDFNFLIASTKDEPLTSEPINKRSINFGSIVSGIDLSGKRISSGGEGLLDSLARFHPLLQVFIPEFSQENIRSQGTDYLVAFVPQTVENGVVPAWDKNGGYHELSIDEEPDAPVIVISENERVMAFSKSGNPGGRILGDCPLPTKPYFEDDYVVYYMRRDVLESQNQCALGPGGGQIENPITLPGCDRDRSQEKDRLYRFKLVDMKTFDAINDQWIGGELEFEVHITVSPLNGSPFTLTKVFYLKNAEVRDCGLFKCNPEWVYKSPEILNWDRKLYGERMQYVWLEYDPGRTITQNYSYSNSYKSGDQTMTNNVNYSISTTDATDKIGDSLVEYCDEIGSDGFIYETGGLFFQLK